MRVTCGHLRHCVRTLASVTVSLAATITVPGTSMALDPSRAVTQYIHRAWENEQGLPQNSVLAIVQARDGYLWLGTQEGLVMFDGVRFTCFRSENTPAMTDNLILALLEDKQGNLWVGTNGGGLLRFASGTVTAFTTANGLCSDRVRCLYENVAGDLWIGTDAGLNRLRRGTLTSYRTKDGLSDGDVLSICGDRGGNLWIGTNAGLTRLKGGRFTTYGRKEGLLSERVKAVFVDHEDNLWVGMLDDRGVSRMDRGAFWPVMEGDRPWEGSVLCIEEDRDGNLWIGTIGSGLKRLRNGMLSAFGSSDALTKDRVVCIQEDREGSLWIGTLVRGLHQIRDGRFLVFTIEEGLSEDFLSAVYEDRGGNLWLGTLGGGLNQLKDGRFRRYTTKDGLSNSSAWSICQTADGSLWIGTARGLNRLKDGRFVVYTTRDGLADDQIWALYEARDGTLWIGTTTGLCALKDGVLRGYGEKEGIPKRTVRYFHQDQEGSLWIGTDAGLFRLKDGALLAYDKTKGLPHMSVNCIHEDADGTLWLGTNGGLARLRGGRLTACTTKDGLFDNMIFHILEDDRGRLWMSCNNGIFCVSKQELNDLADGKTDRVTSTVYGQADGMKSRECNGGSQPAGCRRKDGSLWFPTIKGAVRIDPEKLLSNPLAPPVVIEKLVADGRVTDRTGDVVLPAGTNSMEIHYTALSFVSPEAVSFKYQLDGFDNGWIDAGTRRVAYYTHLSPGRYNFRVIAQNADGVWNETGASLALYQRPLFYQAYWFYTLSALAVVLSGFAMHRIRVRHFEARERALAERVDEVVADLRILKGLLPICASCKKIRDDKGAWNQMEAYIRDHSQAEFTHGICPECAEKLYPGIHRERERPAPR